VRRALVLAGDLLSVAVTVGWLAAGVGLPADLRALLGQAATAFLALLALAGLTGLALAAVALAPQRLPEDHWRQEGARHARD
jgi:hypothetical protein